MRPFSVLILSKDDPTPYRVLESETVRVHFRNPETEDIPEIGEVHAVVGGWFSRELLERAAQLKYFFVPFSGLSSNLKEVLRQREGLCVANSHYNADAVAEHVFAMIFRLCRNLDEMDRYMRRRGFLRGRRPTVDFLSLRGKALGILGRGHIGKEVELRAAAFGMRPISYSRGDFLREGKEGLHELLRRCSFLVLTLPLTEETRGMIGPDEFAEMRSDAVLINVSRGEIVQQKALFDALREKRIRGAGVDAWYNYHNGYFSPEKPYTLPFGKLSNIVMTPHVAYRSDSLEEEKIAAIRSFIAEAATGGPVSNLVDLNRGY